MVSSNENSHRPLSSGDLEGMSWRGLQTIYLHKNLQGFGFTLRHFIVYPPKSYLHGSKDEENGNSIKKCGQESPLQAVDTIFVKSVKENSPAHQAGLCTGDRLVKVNGENILGKTYSQVIRLIQNSEKNLELSVMPKDEDVLQLISAYSQEACLKDNETFSVRDPKLPEPVLRQCSSSNPNSIASQLSHKVYSALDNWQYRPSPTTSLMDSHHAIASTSNWTRAPEDASDIFVTAKRHRGRSSSAVSAFEFHFANHNAAIASATLPPLRNGGPPASSNICTDFLSQRALSEWYCSQTEDAEQLSTFHGRIPADYLAAQDASIAFSETKRQDSLSHRQALADAHNSYFLQRQDGILRPGRISCSDSLLAAYAKFEYNYDRSVKTLQEAALVVPLCANSSLKVDQQSHQKTTRGHEHQIKTVNPSTVSSTVLSCGKQSGQNIAEPQARRVTDELVDYKNGSPSMSHGTCQLPRHAETFREPSNFSCGLDSRSSAAPSEVEMLPQPQWTTTSPQSEDRTLRGRHQDVISPISLIQPLCHNSVAQSLTSPQSPEPSSPVSIGPASKVSKNGSLVQQVYNSLSSIPFKGSIKGRRSSYLLALTTERSKSYDEGLNTFKEEGHVFTKLPKRVKSFFIDGSLEGLKAEEETRSKRHSTSELGTVTFSDISKEGWLHCKQILTDKGKKVAGTMRPWKRLFFVLRSHTLFIYKDKREAVLYESRPGSGLDEYPPLNIRGCLIDIAYSETKRKHTLRLMTQDFSEYLLQAENREEMLAWIKIICENSKIDNEDIGSSRQALINKKLNDYRKQSLTGNKPDSSLKTHRMMAPFLLAKNDNALANRSSKSVDNKTPWGINIMKKSKQMCNPKAFGVRLENCQPAASHKFVPQIVEMCCSVVEATGLEYTGIYRVPGNNAMVSNLQEHLNKGFDINTAEERWQDLNVISSLLKSFFRKLPEPLFTDEKYSHFIDANRIEDTRDRLKTMKKLIQELPDHYYHTLKFLVCHLKRVADYSEKNKMEPRNLALVFGPTLVRTSEDNMTDMVTHMPDRYKIVETLILHCDWFFSDGELRKQEKTPDEDMPNINHLLCNIGRPGMPGKTSGGEPFGERTGVASSGWMQTRPPGTRQRAPLLGLAPDGDPIDPHPASTTSDLFKLSWSTVHDLSTTDIMSKSGIRHLRPLPDSTSDEDFEHRTTEQVNAKEMLQRDNNIFAVTGEATMRKEFEIDPEERRSPPSHDKKSEMQFKPGPQLCPSSFLDSRNQINYTHPRLLPMMSHNLTRE
ncbi:rho GTPase-activating protein 23-like isoform X2 [Corythoichthys intestinalis]|nr:rho GTPase-activating protein 23-like isoform X2 [Corythoichthys intestinalis]